MRLTKRIIDGFDAPAHDKIIFDDELKGFGLRLSPTGRRSFVVQYRKGGRTRRIKVGLYGQITLEEARKIAKRRLGEIANGGDPAEDVKRERLAPTINALCDRFMNDHVAERLKETTKYEYRRCVDLFIRPALGTHKIADVDRSDVARLHHSLRDRPYQANRVLGVISKLFNLAEVWGLRPDGSNPTRHVPKYPEKKRERFLNNEELKRLGRVLDAREAAGLESPFVAAAFRLLILTGCRLREIQTLKWSYIEDGMIILPDSKTGPRRIPLPPTAQQVLARLPAPSDNEFVIIGEVPGQHITDLQRPWRRIRADADLKDVRIHDLRHTYASMAVMKGLNIPMVGKLLGHTQIQTTMRYAHLADQPVRDAANLVSASLGAAIDAISADGAIDIVHAIHEEGCGHAGGANATTSR